MIVISISFLQQQKELGIKLQKQFEVVLQRKLKNKQPLHSG